MSMVLIDEVKTVTAYAMIYCRPQFVVSLNAFTCF
jgi:hypothetical protein